MSKLQGKVAVVTGASKGIGAGIAKQLARDGAAVVVNYSSSKSGADKSCPYRFGPRHADPPTCSDPSSPGISERPCWATTVARDQCGICVPPLQRPA